MESLCMLSMESIAHTKSPLVSGWHWGSWAVPPFYRCGLATPQRLPWWCPSWRLWHSRSSAPKQRSRPLRWLISVDQPTMDWKLMVSHVDTAAVGSNHLGSRQKLKNSGLYFINCPYVHDMNLTFSFLCFPILYITQISYLQLMVEFTFSGKRGRMPFVPSSHSDGTHSLCLSQ